MIPNGSNSPGGGSNTCSRGGAAGQEQLQLLVGSPPMQSSSPTPKQECWVAAQIVRFSKLPSWVTGPLAPGGAGRQRERLLWSCCDQGSAPAAGWRSWRPRPGGVVRLECCRAGVAPPSSGGGGGASTSPPSLESLLPPQQQMHPSWKARTTDQEYVVLNLKG